MKTEFSVFPELKTERLILRKLQLSDVDQLLTLRTDEQVNKYLYRPPMHTIEEAEGFVEKIDQIIEDRQGFYWAICLKNDPKLIGTICYWNLQKEKGLAETGYELMPEFQGQGLMNEAFNAVIRFGVEEVGMKMIIACVHPDNETSIKLLKKNGFVCDEKNEMVSIEDADGLPAYVLSI